MRQLEEHVIIYEPVLTKESCYNSPVIHDLGEFKPQADLIIAHSLSLDLSDVAAKVHTRDHFGQD